MDGCVPGRGEHGSKARRNMRQFTTRVRRCHKLHSLLCKCRSCAEGALIVGVLAPRVVTVLAESALVLVIIDILQVPG